VFQNETMTFCWKTMYGLKEMLNYRVLKLIAFGPHKARRFVIDAYKGIKPLLLNGIIAR
jgi:hypothetical protein